MAQINYGGVNFPNLNAPSGGKRTIWDELRDEKPTPPPTVQAPRPTRPAPPAARPAPPRTIWEMQRGERVPARPVYQPPAGLSPMRQVNAPLAAPIAPPQALDVSRLSPMRQVNAPIIQTTAAPPPVPALRAPVASAPPLVNTLAGIWQAAQTGAQAAPPALQTLAQRFVADQDPGRRAPDPLGAPINRFLGGSEGLAAQVGASPSPSGTELNPVQPYFAPGSPQDIVDYWKRRGALGGLLQLADRPRQAVPGYEPFMAKMWNATAARTYYPEAQRLAEQRADLQRQLRAVMATGAKRDDPAVNALELQIQQVDAQRSANYWNKEVPNQWQAAGQALITPYTSREEKQAAVERYRREAPSPVQFLQALHDPLNVIDFAVAPAYEGYKLASAAAKLRRPLTRTVNGVARIATLADNVALHAEQAARARTGIGRLNPFAPTPYAQAHALTNTANDGLTHILEASTASAEQFDGDAWGLFKRFLQDPDAPEVVQATGGWSQTKQAKDTAIVNRRVLGAWDDDGVAAYAATDRDQRSRSEAAGADRGGCRPRRPGASWTPRPSCPNRRA